MSHITKRFMGTVALKDVSLALYEGEILSVVGENGAGKSTLMKILSGVYPGPDYEGEMEILGRRCSFSGPADAENAGIAMIYQELNLELDLTVAENIMLGRLPVNKIGVIDWKKAREMARAALERLHIQIDVEVTARSLSPSMQQLVCIARALVRNPKILILDEPTSVLTERETEELIGILDGLRKEGIACIYISHKLDEVFQISDRIAVLRDGMYIGEYRREDGFEGARVIEDMIGRRLEAMYPDIERQIGEELLRVENFRVPHPFAYGKSIIEDVSFTLRRGEILGLVGLVGSGRSELVNAIFGVEPKSAGRLYLEGKEIQIRNPRDAKKYGLGLVTEDRKKNGLIGAMSIEHNMTLTILREIRRGISIDAKKEKRIAQKYFDTLNMKAPDLETLVTSLSGGNQQKVILAKWLITNLRVILLDEPTRGIDVGTKAEIYKLIADLASKGISVIMISSEMPELLGVCDRFVVLSKGRVFKEFLRGEADEVELLRAASNT